MNRRQMLRGLGGIAIALPFLDGCASRAKESTASREQALDTMPKRILFMVMSNGVNPDEFWPTGSGTSFTLKSHLAPLSAYKSNMLVLDGIDNKAAMAMAINGHTDSSRCMFTGRKATNTDNDDYTSGGGISLDQRIAKSLEGKTPVKSIEAGASGTSVSFLGANQPAPFVGGAAKIWDRVFASFSGTAGPSPELLALRANRKSVLDAVGAQYTALNKKLGSVDRQRLDEHLTRLRALEKRVTTDVETRACEKPPRLDPPDFGYDDKKLGPWVHTELDVLAEGFACDIMRVGTYIINEGHYRAGFFGVSGSFHDDYIHQLGVRADAAGIINTVKAFEFSHVAYMCDRLKAIPEGDGTVFDNTLVVVVNEFHLGKTHWHDRVPYVMLSGKNRFFEMGRYLKFPAKMVSTNQVFNSILKTFGIDENFGDTAFGTGLAPI